MTDDDLEYLANIMSAPNAARPDLENAVRWLDVITPTDYAAALGKLAHGGELSVEERNMFVSFAGVGAREAAKVLKEQRNVGRDAGEGNGP